MQTAIRESEPSEPEPEPEPGDEGERDEDELLGELDRKNRGMNDIGPCNSCGDETQALIDLPAFRYARLTPDSWLSRCTWVDRPDDSRTTSANLLAVYIGLSDEVVAECEARRKRILRFADNIKYGVGPISWRGGSVR